VATKAPAATGKFTEAIKVAQLAQLGSKDVAALTAANNSEKHDSVALTEAVWRLKVMQGLSSAPLRMHDTAGKYAHAVYSAARKQGVAAKVEADLKAIAALMEAKPKFAGYITNPTIPKTVKKAAIADIAKQHKFSDVTVRFLDLVIANGRVGKIDKVLTSVSKLMAAERNEIKVVVTTAGKVAAKQMEEMKALLLYRVKKQYGSTAQMLLSTAENPALLGGMIVEIGDYRMDLSAATRQAKLRAHILDGLSA